MTMTPAPLMSLIVLSFRRFGQTTGPCLETLLPQLDEGAAELLLVDNGSPDDAAEHCAAFAKAHPRIRYFPLDKNLGFGGGMNHGVSQALAPWVVLVNSDTLFPQGALAALRATLQKVGDDVAMVGPVTNAAGNGQNLPLPEGTPLEQAVAVGAAAMRAPTGLLSPAYRTDFFCVAVREAVWNELGGLDPVFGLGYYEDFDFSLRLAAAGYRQVIAEDVFVVHVGGASFSAKSPEQRALLKRNRAIIRQRHPAIRFEHEREGNLVALKHLLDVAREQGWTDALRQRAAWRWAALHDRRPRSVLKRLRWWWRTRPVANRLRAGGLNPGYPRQPG